MISIEGLKNSGCDVEAGIKRCDGDSEFYLELVESALEEPRYKKLEAQVAAGDWKGAFESAHALKGVVMNLSLTPLSELVCPLTELLRPQKPCDCSEILEKILASRKKIILS